MLGGVSSTFQAPGQALPGWLAESTLPAAKVAAHQLPPAPSSSWLTSGGPTWSHVTEEGPPRAQTPGRMLPTVTRGPTGNQATGLLLLPTQTSISTKIFQEGMAALSEMDSFGPESLPCCIFNVLTYSFHGPGFMEAPPYRLPGKWLPTAPRALPNGKVKSRGEDPQQSGSAGEQRAGAAPAFLQKTPPSLRGPLQAPLLSPRVLPSSLLGLGWHGRKTVTLSRTDSRTTASHRGSQEMCAPPTPVYNLQRLHVSPAHKYTQTQQGHFLPFLI